MGQFPNPFKIFIESEMKFMRKRNLKINIFLNPDEKKIFEEKAKKSRLNQSEFFRNFLN